MFSACTAKYRFVTTHTTTSTASYHGTANRARRSPRLARTSTKTWDRKQASSTYRNAFSSSVNPPGFQKKTWFITTRTPTTVNVSTTANQNHCHAVNRPGVPVPPTSSPASTVSGDPAFPEPEPDALPNSSITTLIADLPQVLRPPAGPVARAAAGAADLVPAAAQEPILFRQLPVSRFGLRCPHPFGAEHLDQRRVERHLDGRGHRVLQ